MAYLLQRMFGGMDTWMCSQVNTQFSNQSDISYWQDYCYVSRSWRPETHSGGPETHSGGSQIFSNEIQSYKKIRGKKRAVLVQSHNWEKSFFSHGDANMWQAHTYRDIIIGSNWGYLSFSRRPCCFVCALEALLCGAKLSIIVVTIIQGHDIKSASRTV